MNQETERILEQLGRQDRAREEQRARELQRRTVWVVYRIDGKPTKHRNRK